MIQLTKDSIRSFYYNVEQNDYFYQDNGERVPDELRKSFNTTVFRRSSSSGRPKISNAELSAKLAKFGLKLDD